jgi:hypothetical protein
LVVGGLADEELEFVEVRVLVREVRANASEGEVLGWG